MAFEVTDNADENFIATLIELHRERWRRAGQCGMIEANRSEGFLRAMAPLFAAQGLLRIFTIRFGWQVCAVLLAFFHRATLFGYLSVFDPSYHQLGFGRELLFESIRYAQAQGCRSWNFLRGDEPYKLSWGARPVEKCRVMICR